MSVGAACSDAAPPTSVPGKDGGGTVPLDAGQADGAAADGGALNPSDASGGGDSGSGGGGANLDAGCGTSRADAPLVRAPVDVIWAIDESGSMIDEFAAVTANINTFANNVAMSGANAHVVMDTTLDPAAASPLASDATRYRWVPGFVQSNNAFRVLLDTFTQYQNFLRQDAPTHIIVITDDRSDMAQAEFRAAMEQRLGHGFIFHAIANPPTMGCPGAFGTGADYFDLAAATGGEQIPVCSSDYTAVFKRLESAVIASAPLPCEFAIPAPPSGEALDPAAVRVVYTPPDATESEFPRALQSEQCGTATAWYYDAPTPTKVLLCPASCDAVRGGGSIDVAFGCAPTILR